MGKTTGTVRRVEEGVGEMLKDSRTGRTRDGLGVAGRGLEDDWAGQKLLGTSPGNFRREGGDGCGHSRGKSPAEATQGQAPNGALSRQPAWSLLSRYRAAPDRSESEFHQGLKASPSSPTEPLLP